MRAMTISIPTNWLYLIWILVWRYGGTYGVVGAKLRSWLGPESFHLTTPPAPRAYFGMVSVYGMLFVFGGGGITGDRNDLLQFDPSTQEWTDLSSSYTAGLPPSPRDSFGFAALNGSLYVFGGVNSDHYFVFFNDMHALDVLALAWSEVTQISAPPPRAWAGFAAAAGRLYLFGGWNGTVYLPGVMGDLHQYDPIMRQWTSPAVGGSKPSPRAFHGFAAGGDLLYLFGGWDGAGDLNDLYMLDPVALVWTSLNSHAGRLPIPRDSFGFAASDDHLYVFGGLHAIPKGSRALSEMYAFSLSTRHWGYLTIADANWPVQQFEQSMVWLDGVLFMFGGLDNSDRYLDVLYQYIPSQREWTNVSVGRLSGTPASRGGSGLAAVGDTLFVFGGQNYEESFNDLYQFDTLAVKWREVTASGGAPVQRCAHGMASVNNSFYVFGGSTGSIFVFGGKGTTSNVLNDLHRFDALDLTWNDLRNSSYGSPPSARGWAGFTSYNAKLFVFGGWNGTGPLNDLFVYDTASSSWSNLSRGRVRGQPPARRASCGLTAAHDKLFVFGGGMNVSVCYNDLHQFDISTMEWKQLDSNAGVRGTPPAARYGLGFTAGANGRLYVVGGLCGSAYVSAGYSYDLHEFNYETRTWSELSRMVLGEGPLERIYVGITVVNNRLFVFGGLSTTLGFLGDITALELPNVVAWPPKGNAYHFVSLYDWDSIALDPLAINLLPRRIELCAGLFPCALSVTGMGIGLLQRVGNGSISCHASAGCTAVTLHALVLKCDGVKSLYAPLETAGSLLNVINASFARCESQADGGTIQAFGAESIIYIDSSTFQSSRSAVSGGAISIVGGTLLVSNSVFINCSSAGGGGGAINAAAYECYGSRQEVPTRVQVAASVFEDCGSGGPGGAILISGRSVGATVNTTAFLRCSSSAAGGGMSVSDMATATVVSSQFERNLAKGAGGGALHAQSAVLTLGSLTCTGNEAPAGGGAVLYWGGEIEPTLLGGHSIAAVLAAAAEGLGRHPMCGVNNTAAYGACIASTYKALRVLGMPTLSAPVFAGLPFTLVLLKADAYNQTVASDSASTLKAATSLNGTAAADPAMSMFGIDVAVVQAGRATFSIVLKPAFTVVDPPQGLTRLEHDPYIYFAGMDVETSLPMESNPVPIAIAGGARVCPAGYILLLDHAPAPGAPRGGVCSPCGAGTYSISPLTGVSPLTPSCFNCPANAACDGSDVTFSLGSWVPLDGMYRLVGCPAGHQLLNSVAGTFSHDVQQCLPCQPTQYILNSNNSKYTCQNCPAGAVCDGATLDGRVPGSVWTKDFAAGVYVLTSCPPGYQLLHATQDGQQCSLCPAASYCIGGANPSAACPSGSFSPQGANSSMDCAAVVFVDVVIAMPIAVTQLAADEQSRLAEALADTCGVLPSRVVVWSVQSARRGQAAESKITVHIAAPDVAAAVALSGRVDIGILNSQLARQGLPACTWATVAVELPAAAAPSGLSQGTLGGALTVVLICCFVLIAMLHRWVYRQQVSEEELAQAARVEELRMRLRMTRADGYILTSERLPLMGRREAFCFVSRGHLEAAARLSLLKEFDLEQFDALCVQLKGTGVGEADATVGRVSVQYQALRTWLLGLSKALIRPQIEHNADDPSSNCRNSLLIENYSVVDNKPQYEFFIKKVSKAWVWQDNDHYLFRELKAEVDVFMEEIAELCNMRFGVLSHEPGGAELVSFRWTGSADAVVRQDHPSVRAILVNDEARKEAGFDTAAHQPSCRIEPHRCPSAPMLLDEELFISQLRRRAKVLNEGFQHRVADVVRRHAARHTSFEHCDSDLFPTAAAATPAGFELLRVSSVESCDTGSQESITTAESAAEHRVDMEERLHLISDIDPDRRRALRISSFFPLARPVSKMASVHGSLVTASVVDLSNRYRRIVCQFRGGPSEVEVHHAPIKTVARMQEKLSEYFAPGAEWPLAANILDPVRVSVVCEGAERILEAVGWFAGGHGGSRPGSPDPAPPDWARPEAGLSVCRLKNKFAYSDKELVGGYRDLMLCVVYEGAGGLRIIGEIQIQDKALFELKRKMHKLYRVKRARAADSI